MKSLILEMLVAELYGFSVGQSVHHFAPGFMDCSGLHFEYKCSGFEFGFPEACNVTLLFIALLSGQKLYSILHFNAVN